GYTVSSNVYDCIIDADGSVTYKLHGSANAATANFPVCVNTKNKLPHSNPGGFTPTGSAPDDPDVPGSTGGAGSSMGAHSKNRPGIPETGVDNLALLILLLAAMC
ncbi:hypothetical protein, partial [Acetanaerobacterium elongatum]